MPRPQSCTHGDRWIFANAKDICVHPSCWAKAVVGSLRITNVGRKCLAQLVRGEDFDDFCQFYATSVLGIMASGNEKAIWCVLSPQITKFRALSYLEQLRKTRRFVSIVDDGPDGSTYNPSPYVICESDLAEAIAAHVVAAGMINPDDASMPALEATRESAELQARLVDLDFITLLMLLRGDIAYGDAIKIEYAVNGLTVTEAMDKLAFQREYVTSHAQFGASDARA